MELLNVVNIEKSPLSDLDFSRVKRKREEITNP